MRGCFTKYEKIEHKSIFCDFFIIYFKLNDALLFSCDK